VDGENCLKVPKSDESAYLAAAERLMDAALRARLGAGARASAQSLGWPSVVADLEKIIRNVLNNA
jgi:glycosyltransferase involved in cell wall biosynthesis